MKSIAVDPIIELLALIGSALGTIAFTIGGLLVEQAAVRNLVSGELSLGAWELWVGTVGLFVGIYLFGYHQFWHRLAAIQQSS